MIPAPLTDRDGAPSRLRPWRCRSAATPSTSELHPEARAKALKKTP